MVNIIKNKYEIEKMREAGKILAKILSEIKSHVKVGIDVWELEEMFIDYCKKSNVIPACKGYTSMGFLPPFPTGLCVSINHQSVHCFPIKGQIINDGDIITVDTVITHKGYNADAAFTKGVGTVSKANQLLMITAKQAMFDAIETVKNNVHIGDISNKIQQTVENKGFNVLRDYAGHGIGKNMHEFPEIPCFGKPGTGHILKSGMTICIEALVCAGKPDIDYVSEWETQMADKKNFVQYEYTVLVKNGSYEILTDFEV